MILSEEPFSIVVAVNIDLGNGVVGGRLGAAFMDTCLQPGQDQLQPVSFLNLKGANSSISVDFSLQKLMKNNFEFSVGKRRGDLNIYVDPIKHSKTPVKSKNFMYSLRQTGISKIKLYI